MKKLFIASLLLGIVFSSFGQNQFGIKAGATLGFFDNEGKEYDFYEPKLGFSFGGIGKFQVSDGLFLKSELIYSQISSSLENSDLFFKLDRISLVLLAGYQLDKIDFELGPEINMVVKGINEDARSRYNQTDQYNKLNIGLNIGTNIGINERFEANARYSIGLLYYDTIQLIDENQGDTGLKSERVSYLSLGVSYYLKN